MDQNFEALCSVYQVVFGGISRSGWGMPVDRTLLQPLGFRGASGFFHGASRWRVQGAGV